jgi:hypothetical protein
VDTQAPALGYSGRAVAGEEAAEVLALNLVGMVGAGKSTIRDILAYWVATQTGRRVTIVVGDVAETQAVVDQLTQLGVSAAPILGHSTRERNIERLHRRTATAGAPTMLAHDQPAFAYLSSACPLDALRGLEAPRPLRIGEAPCLSLYPVARQDQRLVASSVLGEEPDAATAQEVPEKPSRRHGCPLWTRCPEPVNIFETPGRVVYWVASCVDSGGLIHTAVGRGLGAGGLRTNRSGWAA